MNKKITKIWLVKSLLLSMLLGGINQKEAMAETLSYSSLINLDTIDRGWYDASGRHIPTNLNYFIGLGEGPEHRNFFVFDLTALGKVIKATLSLELPKFQFDTFNSDTGVETYSLFEVSTEISTLIDGNGGTDAYNDLGSGTFYGSVDVTKADEGSQVEIILNNEALNSLNRQEDLFAVGGKISTLNESFSDFIFGDTGEVSRTQLILEVAPKPVSVPESEFTIALLTISTLGFGLTLFQQ